MSNYQLTNLLEMGSDLFTPVCELLYGKGLEALDDNVNAVLISFIVFSQFFM